MEKIIVLWSMLVFGLSICSDASAVARFEARDIETKLTELISLVDIKDAQGIVQRYTGKVKDILHITPQAWMGSGDMAIVGNRVEFVGEFNQPHQGKARMGKAKAREILEEIQKEIAELKSGLEKEAGLCVRELEELNGNSAILGELSNSRGGVSLTRALVDRAHKEIARLRQEAEQRRQQEEAGARQEAEKRRQEEEARARREAELNRQREEVRAQQAEEVRLRMQELEDLGGDKSMLSRFENGSGNPEELREYKAALNRADAEIVRLRNEGNLNNQSAIDQLTEEVERQREENRELRSMVEQLMEEVKNLKMGNLRQ